MTSQPKRNTPRIVLGIVLLVGALGVLLFSMQSMFGMRKNAQRVVVPTERLLSFDTPGTYTIFHEFVSTVDGVRYEGHRLPDELSLQATAEGAPVTLERIGGYSNYQGGGSRGESAYRFTLEAGGEYTLTARYNDPSSSNQTVLSIVRWRPRLVELGVGMTGFIVLLTLGILLIQQGVARRPRTTPGDLKAGGFTYENRVEFTGDAALAFSHVRGALTGIGFSKVTISDGTLTAQGPGMMNNKQPPLRGATKIQIEIYGGQASLRAELGGVRFMRNFLYLFPPGLALGLCALFGTLALGDAMPGEAAFAPLIFVLPWLFIGPVLARSIRNRTTNALDLLLEDMQQID